VADSIYMFFLLISILFKVFQCLKYLFSTSLAMAVMLELLQIWWFFTIFFYKNLVYAGEGFRHCMHAQDLLTLTSMASLSFFLKLKYQIRNTRLARDGECYGRHCFYRTRGRWIPCFNRRFVMSCNKSYNFLRYQLLILFIANSFFYGSAKPRVLWLIVAMRAWGEVRLPPLFFSF
jgi:hypothetical protein